MEKDYYIIQLLPEAEKLMDSFADYIGASGMIRATSIDISHHQYLEAEVVLAKEGLDFVTLKALIPHRFVGCIFPASEGKQAGFRTAG